MKGIENGLPGLYKAGTYLPVAVFIGHGRQLSWHDSIWLSASEQVSPDSVENGPILFLLRGKACEPEGRVRFRIADRDGFPAWRFISPADILVRIEKRQA